jgi:predicted dehydrogenase
MKNFSATSVTKFTRRRFVGGATTAAAAFMVLPRRVLGMNGTPGANDRLNLAAVGIGGQGNADLKRFAGENIVALCDVDADYAAHTFAEYPQAARYQDFRVMLEREKGLDAVVVATPDHLHAVVSRAALQHGKHVYCEKPLTHTVVEARTLAEAARTSGRATQMGNQGMTFEGNRILDRWIADQVIGPIHEVHVWSDRPTQRGRMPLWWAQGVERPSETPPVPPTLNWDLWLGPAPLRPYHPAYAPFRWRGWWDFGSGGLGDMGIHNLAPVFAALKLGAPESVSGSSTALVADSVPLASTVHYRFPARGEQPAVDLHWYDGGLLPARPDELEPGVELDPEDGILFVGRKGKILVRGWGGQFPRLLGHPVDPHAPPPSIDEAGHYAEWVTACKTGSPTRSNFSFAGPLTEAVQLGAACIRHGGRLLRWDSANLTVTNDPAANHLLHYQYRSGWSL